MAAGEPSCSAAFAATDVVAAPTASLRGTDPVEWTVAVEAGHEYLIEVALRGNDAVVEARDAGHRLLARSDHPERRSGTRRIVLAPRSGGTALVRVAGKEHGQVSGSVAGRVVDLAGPVAASRCAGVWRLLAAADADYAAGQEVSRGRSGSMGSARHSFLRAAEGYRAAYAALAAVPDDELRGQAALALAGVEYFDLQNWVLAADWAARAAAALARSDPYRRARAQAVLAAAWIELATEAVPGEPVPGLGVDPRDLLSRTHRLLRRLIRFHDARAERYDAALQVNNVGLAEIYAGRFADCAVAFRAAQQRFAALREGPREALAAQNRAMCLWGLGELAAALRSLERALAGMQPDPYPSLYLLTLNNAALLHFALGDLDESLRLHDQALTLALRVQSRREEAQSLFGIGVTYYALGERERARQFLERALAIRSVAFDARGRMSTLRALATIDAEQGRATQALERDREALTLATVPAAAAAIRIQAAIHTAAAGHRAKALQLLDEEVGGAATGDPLVHGTALLQRAVLRREAGDALGALRDLATARPLLRRWGNVTAAFLADLETARSLRALDRTAAALAAVEQALARASAIRLQTANPELRAGLQSPLRQAYELKLDLLWREYVRATGTPRAPRIVAAAFNAADAARAQTFADVAAQRYPDALRREMAPQFARRESLYREIAARRYTLEQHQDAVGSSDARAQQLQAEITGLERGLDTVNDAIAARASAGAAAGGGPSIAAARHLSPRTALVSYWLGPGDAYAWVAVRSGIHWVRLAPSTDVAASARAFYEALTRAAEVPASRRLSTGADLYVRILRPLEPWLRAARTWVIIPDAALDYVPFAALRGGDQGAQSFVVTQHDVAFAPAAWMLRPDPVATARRGTDRLLLVADPVYEASDPRLARGAAAGPAGPPTDPPAAVPVGPVYRRLPWSEREALQVAAEFPPEAVDRLEGLDASRERVLGRDWARYRYIHFATHGVGDARNPQYSALLLSRYDSRGRAVDDALRVADLALLALDAKVVVFSGCETALGKEIANEGLVGLSYTTLARGARAVVASLWPVADEMSARLMTEFYRHLLRGSLPPSAAMGVAMRAVLARDPLADPALWAPFQVSVVTLPAADAPAPATGKNQSPIVAYGETP